MPDLWWFTLHGRRRVLTAGVSAQGVPLRRGNAGNYTHMRHGVGIPRSGCHRRLLATLRCDDNTDILRVGRGARRPPVGLPSLTVTDRHPPLPRLQPAQSALAHLHPPPKTSPPSSNRPTAPQEETPSSPCQRRKQFSRTPRSPTTPQPKELLIKRFFARDATALQRRDIAPVPGPSRSEQCPLPSRRGPLATVALTRRGSSRSRALVSG